MRPNTLNIRLRLLRNIARIESVAYQKNVCLKATVDHYVLLDELIDVTLTRAEHEISTYTENDRWRGHEVIVLKEFVEKVNRLFSQIDWGGRETLDEIIDSSEAMKLIRNAASDCLSSIGFSCTEGELYEDE